MKKCKVCDSELIPIGAKIGMFKRELYHIRI